MNFLDIIIIIPLIWFAYKGLSKGLISEITQLIALIGGVFIASNFSWFVGNRISEWLSVSDKYINLIAFVLTFAGVIFLVVLVRKAVEKMVDATSLNFANKLGGLAFGVLKAALILSCVFYMTNKVDDRAVILKAETRNESMLYHPVSAIAPIIAPKLKISNLIGDMEIPEEEPEDNSDEEETEE